MHRLDFYYRQRVTESELDDGFEFAESADWLQNVDAGLTGVASGLLVSQAGTPNMNVLVALGTAYDPQGRRCNVASQQAQDMATDGSNPTAVTTIGNERWVSLFLTFARNLYDPRTDGLGATVQFHQDELFALVRVQGAEASAGTAVRPALDPNAILLADIKLVYGQTQILGTPTLASPVSGSIDLTRRQDAFATSGTPRSLRRGQTRDALSDLLGWYNAHVTGAADRHTAAQVDYAGGGNWADAVTNPAATVEVQLDKVISDLGGSTGGLKIGAATTAGSPFTLSTTSVKNQIDQLLGFLNGLSAANISYAGSGAWFDTSVISAANVEGAIDEVVSDLAADAGSARVGSAALSYQLLGPTTISAGSIYGQLDSIISALADQTAPVTGAGRIGNDAYTPGTYGITLGSIRSQLQEIVTHLNTIAGAIPTTAAAISYAGSGAWFDATTVSAANVEAAVDEVVSDLAGSGAASGAAKIGCETISWPLGGGALSAASIRSVIVAILAELASTDSVPGAGRVGHDAHSPSSGLFTLGTGSVQSHLKAMLDAWTDNDGTGDDGAARIGGKAVAGSPYSFTQGSVRAQLDYLLNLLNTGIGSNAWKDPARASSITNVNVANPGTAIFDGVTLSNGQILLLLGQAAPAENGLWVFNGSGVALTRPTNFDVSADVVPSMVVTIQEGTARANHIWQLTTNGPITLGTTGLVFEQVYPLPSPYTFAGQYRSAQVTTPVAVNWNSSNVQYIQLANGLNTFTFTNPLAGGVYHLVVKQPSSGAKGTAAWPAAVTWTAGRAPELSFLNNRIDILSFVYDGTNTIYLGSSVVDLRASQSTASVDFVGATTQWVVPPGVTSVTLEAIGAGGGGAGESGGVNGAAAAGGGSYAKLNALVVSPGDVLAVIAGVGGTGGAATPTAGTAGGNSQVTYNGSVVCRGGGGEGGPLATGSGSGGDGGSSNIGDTIYVGGEGGDGAAFLTNSAGGGGGAGSTANGANGDDAGTTFAGGAGGAGNPAGGNGGNGSTGGNGLAGATYGGGGGGGRGGSGGNGANGIVRITYVTTVDKLPSPDTGRKMPVRAATSAALADAYTYDNGLDGYGATLTKTTNGAFPAQDGITLVVGERILLKNQATAAHNGLYVLLQLGDGSNPWILLRAPDASTAESMPPSVEVAVQEGTINADSVWNLTTNGPLVIGTTGLTFTKAYQIGVDLDITSVVTITNASSPYSASWGQTILCDTSGGSITVDLPTASGNSGRKIEVKKKDAANTVTVDGAGSETIDDVATDSLTSDNEKRAYRADGTNVQIV
jgi:hypothetical protein